MSYELTKDNYKDILTEQQIQHKIEDLNAIGYAAALARDTLLHSLVGKDPTPEQEGRLEALSVLGDWYDEGPWNRFEDIFEVREVFEKAETQVWQDKYWPGGPNDYVISYNNVWADYSLRIDSLLNVAVED